MEISMLRDKITRLKAKHKSWRKVGEVFGVSGAVVFRIAKSDYEPQDKIIRAALGLPVMRLAPVCDKCGDIHVTKRCTANSVRTGAKWARVMGHSGWERV